MQFLNTAFIIKSKVLLPSVKGDLRRIWLLFKPLDFLTLKNVEIICFWHVRLRLSQKHVVRTILDVYVFINPPLALICFLIVHHIKIGLS
jgi:hypothetical protein